MRLNWFSPLPPARTEIANYTVRLLPALCASCDVTLWTDQPVSGLAVGVVLSMHTRASLERFGAESLIPAGLAIALVRETGPLTAGLLLAGRIGAGIGAELGAMRVTEQIDALEATAVDAFRFLVVTRVAA